VTTDLDTRLREHAGWYHVLDLPGWTTPGWFDLRAEVPRYGLPDDLTGRRALDVGTWDGFWAFELERRGAQVVALDLDDERKLDWPPRRRPERFNELPRGEGFRLAKAALGSSVERIDGSVYEVGPGDLGGPFDLVLCGSVLIHLRDQLLALQRIAELTAPGGTLVTAEAHWRAGGLLPFACSRYRADRPSDVVFWEPNVRAWRRMLWSAGFDEVREHGRFTMVNQTGGRIPHVIHHARKAP
jgi:tRNA (mo5U34)-methyltransferase